MISEVRLGVKQNLSETFRASFGPHSTAIDEWRSGPGWPAKVAPSPAATNSQGLSPHIRMRCFGTARSSQGRAVVWRGEANP